MIAILDHYMDPSTEAEQVAWTEGLHEQLAARSVGVYSNFLAIEGDQRIHEAYPGAAYARLADIKRRYDPSNLFSLNQNIRPAGSPS